MRLAYILNQRFPTEKAYGIQVAKMCEAFARHGHEVTLYVPTRRSMFNPCPFQYYSVQGFRIQRIPSPDWYWPGPLDRIAVLIKGWISARRLVRAARAWHPDIIYTRDRSVAPFADVVEAHQPMRPHSRIVAISQVLKNVLVSAGALSDHVLVAHDGVDLKEFEVSDSKEQCREQFNLPRDHYIALYTGSRYYWKGVEIFTEAARMLPGIHFGAVSDRPHHDIPKLLHAADVLVIPNRAEGDRAQFTSPLKLFEYMASSVPIVASDLPVLREVLSDSDTQFFPPSDAKALAERIQFLKGNPDIAVSQAEHARELVREFTWDKRAQRILEFIKTK